MRSWCIRWPWCRPDTPKMSSQKIAQHGNEWQVGCGHRISGGVAHKIAGSHPFQYRMMARLRHAVPAAAYIERHQKVKCVVGMRSKGEWRETGLLHGYAQLLRQFADERILGP